MNRGFHAARLAIAASLRGPALLSGQDATHKITGTVTDPSGSAVPRAKITVLDTIRISPRTLRPIKTVSIELYRSRAAIKIDLPTCEHYCF